MKFFQAHAGKFIFAAVIVFVVFLGNAMLNAPVVGMENKLVYLLKEYGYIILFAWSVLEGESGLIMAGLLCHTGDMNLFLSIFVAGLGGFVGDQIYFYIGRYNKDYIHTNFSSQRRKFALAHLLLKKYGWPIIFAQRYMYGMRTILPISIGLTRFDARQIAIINLISAWCWAAITIIPAWYFGQEILEVIKYAKAHWYFALPFAFIVGGAIYYYFHNVTTKQGIKKGQ